MASRVSNYLHFDERLQIRLQIASQRKNAYIPSKFLRNLHFHKNLIFLFFLFTVIVVLSTNKYILYERSSCCIRSSQRNDKTQITRAR